MNYNPFETIDKRLSTIESLVKELNENSQKKVNSTNLTIKEASKLLKVSKQSVHKYIKKGFIPAKKLGRKYLIKQADIEFALQEVKSLKYKRDV